MPHTIIFGIPNHISIIIAIAIVVVATTIWC